VSSWASPMRSFSGPRMMLQLVLYRRGCSRIASFAGSVPQWEAPRR
jgi:hypothetical protein